MKTNQPKSIYNQMYIAQKHTTYTDTMPPTNKNTFKTKRHTRVKTAHFTNLDIC